MDRQVLRILRAALFAVLLTAPLLITRVSAKPAPPRPRRPLQMPLF